MYASTWLGIEGMPLPSALPQEPCAALDTRTSWKNVMKRAPQ